MKSVRLLLCLALTGFALVGCPPESGSLNMGPDDTEPPDPQPAQVRSFIVVIVESQSTSGLAEILVDDLAGDVTLFPFQPVLPPGTRGEACCVSPGIYDVVFEMEGTGFTTFEMQELLPNMDHVYTLNVTSDTVVLTSTRVEPHVDDE